MLRKFCRSDLKYLLAHFADEDINTYLPWFPLKLADEAEAFFEERYTEVYRKSCGYKYAVCLKSDSILVGWVNVATDDSHDLGCGLCRRTDTRES